MKLFIYKLLGIRKYPVHPAARFITPRSRVNEVDLQNFGRASYSSRRSSVQGVEELVAELQKNVCPKKKLRLPTRVLWFELADTQLPLWFGISFATLVFMFGVTGVFGLHAMQLREIAKQNARTENNLSAFAHAKNITIARTNILARTQGQVVSNSPKPEVARQQHASAQKVTASNTRSSPTVSNEPAKNFNQKSENLNLPTFSGQVLGTSIQSPLTENDIRAMVDNYLREKNLSSGLVQNQNGNTTAVIGNTPIVTYVPPVPSQGFGGASLSGFTTLSAEHFNTSNANITSSLTVSGTASFTGSVSFAGVSYSWPTVVGTSGQVLSSDGLGQLSWVDISVAGATWSTSTNGTIYYTGGNVGVGTSTPVLPLQVSATGPYSGTANGVAQGTSWAYLWTASGNNPAIIWNSSANRLRFGPETGVGSGFSEKMTITTTGNVGIGTTSPIAKLDVWGNLNVATSSTPALFVDTANGRVGIGASSPSAPLTVVGQTAGSAGLLITSGNTNLGYANAGGIQFGYGAAGSALNTVRVARIMALTQSGGGGDLYFETATSSSGSFNTNMVILNSGNVGIGTTSPLAKLDVYGNLNVATSSTSVLFANTGTSRVGIGTSTPADTLHIVTTSAFAGLTVQSTNDVGVSIKSQAGNGAELKFPTQGVHLFARANSGNLFIGNSGGTVEMIGINGSVSSPNSVVIGRQGAAQSIGNGTLLVYDATASTGITTLNIQEGAGQGATSTLNVLANNGTTTRFTIQGGTGNVGIGTSSPVSGLDIATAYPQITLGALNQAGQIQFRNGSAGTVTGYVGYASAGSGASPFVISATGAGVELRLNPNNATGFQTFYAGTTERVRIQSDGNVGIGTSTPLATLHVQGSGANNSFTISSSTGANLFTMYPTGNIGIGPVGTGNGLAPNSKIFVTYADGSASAINNGLTLNNIAGQPGNFVGIRFGLYSGNDTAQKQFIGATMSSSGSGGTGDLVFMTITNGGSAYQQVAAADEKMRITHYGNVGIGTTGPTALLHVNSASSTQNLLAVTTSTNNSIFVVNPNGNVGIGTNNPLLQFHMLKSVSGGAGPTMLLENNMGQLNDEARIDGILNGGSSISNRIGFIRTNSPASTDTDIYFSTRGNAALGERMRITSLGNVGIGTTSPAAKLDLYFSGGGLPRLFNSNMNYGTGVGSNYIANQITATYGGGSTGALTGLRIDTTNSGSGATYGLIVNGGNVGIGTTSPGYKLDVAGSLNAQEIRVNGVVLNPGTGSNWTVTGSDVYRLAGNVGVGTATPSSTLVVAGNSLFTATSTFLGNVGIGTAVPGAKLEVSGTGGTSPYLMINRDNVAGRNAGWLLGGGAIYNLKTQVGGSIVQALGPNGGMSLGTTFSSTDPPANGMIIEGNVGIGTTSPQYLLDVYGTVNIVNSGVLRVGGGTAISATLVHFASSGTAGSPGYSFGSETTTGMWRAGTGLLAFSTSGTERVRIDNSGNVGIGTTTPDEKLVISGAGLNRVKVISTNSIAAFRLQGEDTVAADLARASGNKWGFGLIGASNDLSFWDATQSDTVRFVIKTTSGNVGIGTTSPSQMLTVGNNNQFTVSNTGIASLYAATPSFQTWVNGNPNYSKFGFISSNGTAQIVTNVGLEVLNGASLTQRLYVSSGGDISFNSTQLVIQNSTGNVGIGTTNPGAKLEISDATTPDMRFWKAGSYNGQIGRIYAVADGGAWTDARLTLQSVTDGGAYLDTVNLKNGNVGIGTTTPTLGPLTISSGAYVTAGGTWTNASDRNLKENFASVTPASILEKIVNLPIAKWNYKRENSAITHLGPTAQDFYAAFGLGGSNTSISTIDPSGVALVGIQALNDKLNTLQITLNNLQNTGKDVASTTPIDFKTHLYLSKDSVGQAKILAGSKTVRVSFNQPYEYQPIVTVTPTDFVSGAYRIASTTAEGFNIELKYAQDENVTFNYHAFASPEAKLTVSDGSSEDVVLVVPQVAGASVVAGDTEKENVNNPPSTAGEENVVAPPSDSEPSTPSTGSGSSTPPTGSGSAIFQGDSETIIQETPPPTAEPAPVVEEPL